jgi:hypothetical protein
MFTMRNKRRTGTIPMLVALIACLITMQVHGMGASEHNMLAARLLGTAPGNGGAAGISGTKVHAINTWMDYPARQLGQYTVNSTDELVTAFNHRMLRHNPVRVAKAMSGTGKVSLAELNVARAHKVADVLTTRSGKVLVASQ